MVLSLLQGAKYEAPGSGILRDGVPWAEERGEGSAKDPDVKKRRN